MIHRNRAVDVHCEEGHSLAVFFRRGSHESAHRLIKSRRRVGTIEGYRNVVRPRPGAPLKGHHIVCGDRDTTRPGETHPTSVPVTADDLNQVERRELLVKKRI